MSKIRSQFISLLDESVQTEGFLDNIKNIFKNKEAEPQTSVIDPTLTGNTPMTYQDAINSLEDMLQYQYNTDKDPYTKGWCQGLLNGLKNKIKSGEKKPNDIIKDFGFISDQITNLGINQAKEDVADFNTISDTYRMQDMPQ